MSSISVITEKIREVWDIDTSFNIEDKTNIIWNLEDGWNSAYDNNKLLKGQLHDYENKYNLKIPYVRSSTIQWTGEVKYMSFFLKYKSFFDNYFEFEFRINKEDKTCELFNIYEIINFYDRVPSELDIPKIKVKSVRDAMIFCLLYSYQKNI